MQGVPPDFAPATRAWLQARLSGGLPDGVAGPEPDADPADTGDEP